MEEKTKTYLKYGALAVGGYLLYQHLKAKPKHEKTVKSAAAPLAPPTPANLPYSPVSLPGAGYSPYTPPYAPPYYPPQYPYPTPYLPGTPYIPPITNYPGYPSTPPPYIPGVGLPQTVIGLGLNAARAALQAQGYFVVVATSNGVPPVRQPVIPPNIPVAYLDMRGGVVQNVRYSNQPAYAQQPSPYGATY